MAVMAKPLYVFYCWYYLIA